MICVNCYRNFVGSKYPSLMNTSAVTGNSLVPASSWLKNLTALVANAKRSISAVIEMPNRDFWVDFVALEVEGGKSKAVGAMCLSIETLHPVGHC